VRGSGSLPFTAKPPANHTRIGIKRTALAPRDAMFDKIGGKLHVVFIDEQQDPDLIGTFAVLYYDQLECFTSSSG
jgi:hypothetical protein